MLAVSASSDPSAKSKLGCLVCPFWPSCTVTSRVSKHQEVQSMLLWTRTECPLCRLTWRHTLGAGVWGAYQNSKLWIATWSWCWLLWKVPVVLGRLILPVDFALCSKVQRGTSVIPRCLEIWPSWPNVNQERFNMLPTWPPWMNIERVDGARCLEIWPSWPNVNQERPICTQPDTVNEHREDRPRCLEIWPSWPNVNQERCTQHGHHK